MPLKLLGKSLGLPGFKRDLMIAIPSAPGYTAKWSMTEKSKDMIGMIPSRLRRTSEGIPSIPGDRAGRKRFRAASVSASVVGSDGQSNDDARKLATQSSAIELIDSFHTGSLNIALPRPVDPLLVRCGLGSF